MARWARLVIPGMPHHVTRRGNRRQQTFFNDGDDAAYMQLIAEWCRDEGVDIWAYCLMPNHTHLIAVPACEQALRRAIGEAHRRYTRRINFRDKWRGYLWQGRFASFVMDEPYLLAAVGASGVGHCSKGEGNLRGRLGVHAKAPLQSQGLSVSNAKLLNRRGGLYLRASPGARRKIMQYCPPPAQTRLHRVPMPPRRGHLKCPRLALYSPPVFCRSRLACIP